MASEAGLRPGEIAALFNAMIGSIEAEPKCWRLTRVLGSMLAFDFGGGIATRSPGGRETSIGSMILSVGNAYWWVSGAKRRLNSVNLDEAAFEEMCGLFVDTHLTSVEAHSGALRFIFNGGPSLNVDMTNQWEQDGDEEVCTLRLTGSVSLNLSPGGQVKFRPEQETLRQAA